VDFGNFYELYAIAAAVLGGCSLRGGEGAILGVIVGTALMQVLRNMITLVTSHNNIEFAIIGAVILIGVIADELVKRYAVRRRAAGALLAEGKETPAP
jgi:ribose transport system permease protein